MEEVGLVWWITICPLLPKSILSLASSKATVFTSMFARNFKAPEKNMVWGCFSWNGVGAFHQIKGMLTKERYRQILIRQMRPSARRLHEDNFIFQHDNDPKHTANIVTNYLKNQHIEVLFLATTKPGLEIQLKICGQSLTEKWINVHVKVRNNCLSVWKGHGRVSATITYINL